MEPYIHAVNAVDAVEAFNSDIGAAWLWGLWVIPPQLYEMCLAIYVP